MKPSILTGFKIDGFQVCFSLLNLDYAAIISVIDAECYDDQFGRFEALAIPQF